MAADWDSIDEASKWMDDWINSNKIITGKAVNMKHLKERMYERGRLYLADLWDVGIFSRDGSLGMHRANITKTHVTKELECVIKLRAKGLGEFVLKKKPSDSEFSVVTFIDEEGCSIDNYLNQAIKQAKEAGATSKVGHLYDLKTRLKRK